MIHIISFFWRRIFPLALLAGAIYFFTEGANYLVGGILLLVAVLFWQVGGMLMTGWWHRWMKVSLMIFGLTLFAVLIFGYFIYTSWVQGGQLSI